MPKFIIADDHAVLREGLRAMIVQNPEWQVVGEAGNGFEVLNQVEKLSPDILIIDMSMPNLGGIECIQKLQKMDKKPCILVLSAKEDENSVTEAMRSGAKGYVPKSSSTDEIEFAIKSILKGQTYLSPTITTAVLSRNNDKNALIVNPLSTLTTREREIMKLLCEGHPNREVAKMLFISPRTIDSHRANIMKKLGVETNAELVQLAIKNGLIE